MALNRQLAEKTQLLQTTLGSISQGIFMVGVDGRIDSFNHRVCELLGLTEEFLNQRPTLAEITRFQMRRGDFGADAHECGAGLAAVEVPSTVLLLGPNHHGAGTGVALSGAGAWR